MKSVRALPEGYRELLSVDMKKDKKLAVLVNALSLLIAAVLGLPVHFFSIPFTSIGWGGQKAYTTFACPKCGKIEDSGRKWFVMPNDLIVSLVFIF